MSSTSIPKSSAAVPAATIEYSRAALNLVNRNLRTLQQAKGSSTPLDVNSYAHPKGAPPRSMEAGAHAEWYLRVASMLDDFHTGYVFANTEHDQLLDQPITKQQERGLKLLIPTCHICGSTLFPGTASSQCRLVAARKKKRKRQPKSRRKSTKLQPDGLAEHLDLKVPEVKNAKNRIIITCRLCGNKCVIPALDSNNNNKDTPCKKKESQTLPVRKVEPAAADEPLDFVPLGAAKAMPLAKVPAESSREQQLQRLDKKKKPKKKKLKKGTSQLRDFLSTLND